MELTEMMSLPLSIMLKWCCTRFGGYVSGIVVFTLLTKLILLPISAWVQKNSIAMVRLMPEINRLKMEYYGDKDTIADRTQALYKRERYSPFVSTIPMILQVVLLLGVMDAVRQVMGGGDTVLNAIPGSTGGWTYLMPLGAACAALALGLAQNRLNPLQREQDRKEQWMTNGVSVAISLVLGTYVSLGVGVYWICSNLFSIAQQALLNLMIQPKKYIDYTALAASKQELAAMNSLGRGVSKADKQRERQDYKRFFSVANKHLVFYSEKSGFYKYFKKVIEYLLTHSNVIVHYVTNDPNDQIFEIAKEHSRIRPYYIGKNRLITLMMKMDADMVVMCCPDLDNYYIKRSYVRKDVEYVYIFHYPLSTHMVYTKGALDHFDTVFCVGDFQIAEIRAEEQLENLPEKKLIPVGYGLLEQLHESYQNMQPTSRSRPKILIAPSWQTDNILDSCLDALLEPLLTGDYQLVVRPHPEYVKRFGPRMDAIVARYRDRGVEFELDFSGNRSIFDSDILITDWSGIAYESAFVTLKPVVFIDTAPKIYNPDYEKIGIEPLELTLRDQVGVRIAPENVAVLPREIARLLAEGEQYSQKIAALREKYIANFGTSGQVAGKYILAQLKQRQQDRKEGRKQ